MARKQKDYLAGLLADDEPEATTAPPPPRPRPEYKSADADRVQEEDTPSPAPPAPLRRDRRSGTTLLARENALARISSGEVRQVTQLLLDPARVRIWPGNARSYQHLTEDSCRELIDSIIAEGGQKVPAVVRRVEDDPAYDYEVVAGTRRHWSISWLRAHSYPDMALLAQVQQIDDESAFRLADLENRARADVSDLERARNYAAALADHYDNHQTRMAERLRLSKGWLSKMLRVAALPDLVVDAFASPAEIQLKPAYPLAQAAEGSHRVEMLKLAKQLAREQADLRRAGQPGIPAAEVIARLLKAGSDAADRPDEVVIDGAHGRPAVTVAGSSRQGVTLRLHSGHGLSDQQLLDKVGAALGRLQRQGRGLQR
jgi:ParB family chromosome partitioning protein